jgi:hypothetical protein
MVSLQRKAMDQLVQCKAMELVPNKAMELVVMTLQPQRMTMELLIKTWQLYMKIM